MRAISQEIATLYRSQTAGIEVRNTDSLLLISFNFGNDYAYIEMSALMKICSKPN